MSDPSGILGQCLSYLNQVSDVINRFVDESSDVTMHFDQIYESACSLHVSERAKESAREVVCPGFQTLVPSMQTFVGSCKSALEESPLPASVSRSWTMQHEVQKKLDLRLEALYALLQQKQPLCVGHDLDLSIELTASVCKTVHIMLIDIIANLSINAKAYDSPTSTITMELIPSIDKLDKSPLVLQRTYAHLDVAAISRSTATPQQLQPVTVFEIIVSEEDKIDGFTPRSFKQAEDLLRVVKNVVSVVNNNSSSSSNSNSNGSSSSSNNHINNHSGISNSSNASGNIQNSNTTTHVLDITANTANTTDNNICTPDLHTGLVIRLPAPPQLSVKPLSLHLLELLCRLQERLVLSAIKQHAVAALHDLRMACCAVWRLQPQSLPNSAECMLAFSLLKTIQSMALVFSPSTMLTMREAAELRMPGVFSRPLQMAIVNTYRAVLDYTKSPKRPFPPALTALKHWVDRADQVGDVIPDKDAWQSDWSVLYSTSTSPCHMLISVSHLLTLHVQAQAQPNQLHRFVPVLESLQRSRANSCVFVNIPFQLRCLDLYILKSRQACSADTAEHIESLLTLTATIGKSLVKTGPSAPYSFLGTACTMLATCKPPVAFGTDQWPLPTLTAAQAHPRCSVITTVANVEIYGALPGVIPTHAPFLFPENQVDWQLKQHAQGLTLPTTLFSNLCLLAALQHLATTNITATSCIALLNADSEVTLAFELGTLACKPSYSTVFPEHCLDVLDRQVFVHSSVHMAPSKSGPAVTALSVGKVLLILLTDSEMQPTPRVTDFLGRLLLFLLDPVWVVHGTHDFAQFKQSLHFLMLIPTAKQLGRSLQREGPKGAVYAVPELLLRVAELFTEAMQKIYMFTYPQGSFVSSFYAVMHAAVSHLALAYLDPALYDGSSAPHPLAISLLSETLTTAAAFQAKDLAEGFLRLVEHWRDHKVPETPYADCIAAALQAQSKVFVQSTCAGGSLLTDAHASTQCGSLLPAILSTQISYAAARVAEISPSIIPAYALTCKTKPITALTPWSGLAAPLTVFPALPTLPSSKLDIVCPYILPSLFMRLKTLHLFLELLPFSEVIGTVFVLAHYCCVAPVPELSKLACVILCQSLTMLISSSDLTLAPHFDRLVLETADVLLAHTGVTVSLYLLNAVFETICSLLPPNHPLQRTLIHRVLDHAQAVQTYALSLSPSSTPHYHVLTTYLLATSAQLLAYGSISSAHTLCLRIRAILNNFPAQTLVQTTGHTQTTISLQKYAQLSVQQALLAKHNSHMHNIVLDLLFPVK